MNRDFFSIPLHVQVITLGNCPKCNHLNTKLIHDYGMMRYIELEKKMDETNHVIEPIQCQKCQASYSPKYLSYVEATNKMEITRVKISYGSEIDHESFEEMNEGHKKRYEIFKEHEQEFWEMYEQYALDHWREVVNELRKEEIEEAYAKMGIETDKSTVAQYRRDVLQRFKTDEEKRQFWRQANHYFIVDHLLEIGPLGWRVELDAKDYGQLRTRFAVLHFPLADSLEKERTKFIGQIVKKDKGDNAFLFNRIGQLTEELTRTKKRNTDLYHKIESMKFEIADYQKKLNEAYNEIRKLRENQQVVSRDPDDIRKIHELKSFISELMTELKKQDEKIQELTSATNGAVEPATLEEDIPSEKQEQSIDLSTLEGKTVGIIGGFRKVHKEYLCTILLHTGETLNPDFYNLLNRSDILVVLTQFVSHAAMWEAKAFAITEDKPIFFEKAINLDRILENIVDSFS